MAAHINIKSLRLRLGWTQSDLARRLKCPVADVIDWERGLKDPGASYMAELELLISYADACAFELQSSPRAENVCDKKALGQINLSIIEDYDKT